MSRWLRVARLISDIAVPPVLAIPVYTVSSLYDQIRNGAAGGFILAGLFFSITFSLTIPAGFIVYQFRHNKVSELHIPVRQQRNLPYAINIVSNFVGFMLIARFLGLGALAAVMLINVALGCVVTLVNLYWKISAHVIGAGMPLAVLVWFFGWAALPFFLLIPLVGWARLYLKAHTLSQVVAGAILGFTLTFLLIVLIFHPAGWI